MIGQGHAGAFLIQFQSGADLEGGRCLGRVEHVASTRSIRFASLPELVGFMSRVLREVGRGAANEAPPAAAE